MYAYIALIILHVACVAVLLLAIFVRRKRLTFLAVVAGAIGIWIPLTVHLTALGKPNPYVPEGDFQLISAITDDTKGILYIYVKPLEDAYAPQMFELPLAKNNLRPEITEYDGSLRVVHIEPNGDGVMEMVYIDYEPPDIPKGNVRQRY